MSDGGKGDKRRPASVSQEEFKARWEAIFPVVKSKKQVELERQGHFFKGQEALSNHELDEDKPCYCGRPPKGKKEQEVEDKGSIGETKKDEDICPTRLSSEARRGDCPSCCCG